MSENIYLNECCACGEIMFCFIKVCYCDGPLEMKLFPIEKKTVAAGYPHRKLLYVIRGKAK